MNHPKLFIWALLIFLSFTVACERSTSPITNRQVTLSAYYVGVTDAEIRLSISNLEGGLEFRLFRDDALLHSGNLITTDTVIYDSVLTPGQTYNYRVEILKDQKLTAKSQSLRMTTIDTTSQDFTWEIIQFGKPSSSRLEDVAIIENDDIWLVGDINADTGNFNAVHWDGQQWELKRIPYIYNGSQIISSIKWIFAFNENDIWFGNSVHWDGQDFKNADIAITIFYGIGTKKMWGSPNGELYVVGNQGRIAYSTDQGKNWWRLQSGTNEPINDIYGINVANRSTQEVLCAVADIYNNFDGRIITIKPNLTVEEFPWVNKLVHSLWAEDYHRIYACGAGIWEYKGKKWEEFKNVEGAFRRRIRGNAINDIFVCGDYGYISHFNGITWKTYRLMDFGIFKSLDVKGDLVVIVEEHGKAVVGRRDN